MRPLGAMRLIRIGWSAVRIPNELPKPFLERQRGGRRADFRAVDHEDVRIPSVLGPFASPIGKAIQGCIIVARLDILVHPLETGVGEIRGIGFNAGIVVGILQHDRDIPSAAELKEFLVVEAPVTRLDRVANLHPVNRVRKQVDEAGNVVGIEPAVMGELPEDRAELVAKRRKPLIEEAGQALLRFSQLGFHHAIA
jgi:hypothetical protein